MYIQRIQLGGGAACLPIIALLVTGCAAVTPAPVVKTGDRVNIHFTCRLPGGELAATTRKEVALDRALPKAGIFLSVQNDEAIPAVAGLKDGASSPSFEDEIVRQLALAAVGVREGEERAVTLSATASALRDGEEQRLELMRRQRHAKELTISVADYRRKLKAEPAVGNEFALEPGFTGRITAATDTELKVAVSAVPGAVLAGALGRSTVLDEGDHYETELDVKVGALIRSGGLVGRVSEVAPDRFVIDYSNPFGGQSLDCSFSVAAESGEKAEQPAVKSAGAGAGAAALPADGAPKETPAPLAGEAAGQGIDQAQMERIKAAVQDALNSGKGSLDLDLSALGGAASVGDLVQARFRASNTDGTPLALPQGSALQDSPQELVAGKDEVFPGVGAALVGMAAGEKKKVTLAPEQAFGPRDETKIVKLPRRNTVPRSLTFPAGEYVKRFGGFPTPGKEVKLAPYLTARVATVGEKEVSLEVSATDGARFEEPIGTVTVSVGKESIALELEPKLGAPFTIKEQQGVITSSDAETFSVDGNHPLAGKTVVLDLEVVSVTKKAAGSAAPIPWIEEHDRGLAEAKSQGKPVFLLLYADWCGWCKKTLTETLPDPRLSGLNDKFVWVKVNSDRETKYKTQYGQEGYPLMLVLNPDGTLRKRIDGYRDARALKAELEGVL